MSKLESCSKLLYITETARYLSHSSDCQTNLGRCITLHNINDDVITQMYVYSDSLMERKI